MSRASGLPAHLLVCLGCGLFFGCSPPESRSPDSPASESSHANRSAASPPPDESDEQDEPDEEEKAIFEDVTVASGLDFVHFNGMSGRFYYSEMMGSGGALLDADGDGDLDLFLVQGAELGSEPGRTPNRVPAAESLRPPPEAMLPLRDRLYLNAGVDGNGVDPQGIPRFRDATAESGLDSRGYGMGAVAADFDGDGHEDLYVTNAGPNELWLGRGDGTFERSADEASRVAEWSVAAVPLDADGDGDLDLFVANYVDYSISVDKSCTDTLGHRNYCGPLAYAPVRDVLLRNRGNGTFEDVSLSAGLGQAFGRALGATATDFDADGQLEIFVANDGDENQLWHLRSGGAGTGADPVYGDVALLWGVAVNATGHAEASMGVALGDADGDGDEDLFVSHLNRETNTLYLSRERLPRENLSRENLSRESLSRGKARVDGVGFDDRSTESGLGAPSFDRTGFGTLFVDWDLDGDLDVLVANGAVRVIAEQALEGDVYPLHQPNQLFENQGRPGGPPRFVEVEGDPWTQASEVSRAILAGDLDNDGDDDLVVTNNAGPARIFLNRTVNRGGDGKSWIGVRPMNPNGGTAHHAVAELELADGRRLVRRVAVATGYAASQDPRLRFGLGTVVPDDVDISVLWPDGTVEHYSALATGRYHELRQGQGQKEREKE